MLTWRSLCFLQLVSVCRGHQLTRSSSSSRSVLLELRGGELAPSIDRLLTEDELDVALDEAGEALVVVDFYAEWCGPCKTLAPALEALARKTPASKVLFYKVDVDEARELAAAKGVKSMPTIQFYRKGEKVHQVVGGDINAVRQEVIKASLPGLVRALRLDNVAAMLSSSPQQSAILVGAIAYLLVPWQRVLQQA